MKKIALALAVFASTLSAGEVVWSTNNPAPWASSDKGKHFLVGAGVGWFVGEYAAYRGSEHPWVWSLVAGLTLGALKEIYDMKHGGKADVADFLNTVAGAGCGGYIVTIRYRF